jgi:NAD(P)-dependent dehydrogenase (short-subunit alcohol dehydrogenase family)
VTALAGKTVIVTGASGGIGRRLAVGFASEGADLVLQYHEREAEAREIARAIEAMGRRVQVVQADLREPTGAESLIARALELTGRCDVLMNNAGGAQRTPFLEVTPAVWRQTFATNVESAFFCTQAVARHMIAHHGGKIVNMGSIVAELATASLVPYCSAKAALHMLTKAAAVALAPHRITVNAIAPGVVMTERMQTRMEDPRNLRPVLERTPMGTLVRPEDLIGVAVFLASSLSDHITGQIITVDHGYSLEGLEWQAE